MSLAYGKHFKIRKTSQSQPIPVSGQVKNSAGGYAFPVDDWTRLHRFLILGSEGGSYYATEARLTRENAKAVLRCIEADGMRVVSEIRAVSTSGRAPKTDPAIFALAMCAGLGSSDVKKAALDALPEVCRTGTHLFHFAEYVQGFRGWGRGLREAVGRWYNEKSPGDVAYQAIKYVQRDGWSHRDLLRKAHPVAATEEHDRIYRWIVSGETDVRDESSEAMNRIAAVEALKRAETGEAVRLIREYDLPREAVPTEQLAHAEVWEALLEKMPMTAMIRNLATMTRLGLIAPMSEATARVTRELGSQDRLRKARVHPMTILSALKTYSQGHGERGKNSWTPVPQVVDALDGAFYASFGNVRPTGKRICLALDVSGSMEYGFIAGAPGLTPRVASAAMALITAAVEPNHCFMAFSHQPVPVSISPRQRLDDVVKTLSRLPFGGTDCALPMIWAMQNRTTLDAFVVFTDNETWFGNIHPCQALQEYRRKMSVPARLAVLGMVANGFSIADPNDGGMMDLCGFDTATPQVLSDFINGKV